MSDETKPLVIGYTNWRGEYSVRRILPKYPFFDTTEWHPEPQWLLRAFDLDKQADRDFAIKDFGTPTPSAPVDAGLGERLLDQATLSDEWDAWEMGAPVPARFLHKTNAAILREADARVKVLEEALTPFAAAAEHVPDSEAGTKIVANVPAGPHAAAFKRMAGMLTAGAFRAARQALKTQG